MFLFSTSLAWAQQEREALPLLPTDRILVIAPHPDDEVIGAGGLMQEALKLKIPVRVLYLTNGDSNSLAFLYYKKRPVLGRRQALNMGELRQKEAAQAMEFLGVDAKDLIFLGYPDFGTLNIFKKYWQTPKAYRSVLTRVDHNPYALSLSPGAAYKARNVLNDLKKVIEDFGPSKIFVTHPSDSNADHQAAYLFCKVALWELNKNSNEVSLLTYLVHASNWPRPLGFHPEFRLDPPKYLMLSNARWMNFELNNENIERKKDAFYLYKTQIPYKPKFLFTFVRPNELFALNDELSLTVSPSIQIDWSNEEKRQGAFINNRVWKPARVKMLHSVVYALSPGKMLLRIRLNQTAFKDADLDVYLFGFRRDVPFDDMPKIHLKINRNLNADVFDGKKHLRHTGVQVSRLGNDIMVAVPDELTRFPQKLMGSVNVRIQSLPLESSAWQIMELNYGT